MTLDDGFVAESCIVYFNKMVLDDFFTSTNFITGGSEVQFVIHFHD